MKQMFKDITVAGAIGMALMLAIVLAVTGNVTASEKVAIVDRDLSLPGFVGWVEDEFIVVLKEEATRSVAPKALLSDKAFAGISELDRLDQQFGVQRVVKQFQTATFSKAAATSRDLARYFKVQFTVGTLDEAMSAYSAIDQVDHVEPIGIHTLYASPNDTYYDNPPASFPYEQWHYWDTHSIDADLAWDTQSGDATVVVGILDSGTRYFHTDLGGNNAPWDPSNPQTNGNIFINPGEIAGNGIDDDGNGKIDDVVGWDFVSSAGGFGVNCIDQDCGGVDNDPDDGDGHGTHVSGTVGAITNNGRAVAGVAGGFSDGTTSGVGNGVKILPCRIGYHAKYRGFTTGVVRMDWAAEAMNYISDMVDAGHNVAAINCSWGSSNSGGLGAATTNLLAHDVVIVVSAGNSNSSSTSYLNSRGDCFDVAATDRNGNGASFTNYGSWVDVAAPGVDIMSTYANPDDADLTHNYVALMSGTSMSAPHICGIVALLESCNPALTGPQKFDLIVNNTDPYTDSRDLGSGIANANLALAASCATCTDVTPVADFSGSPTSGDAPLTVSFTDLSTNSPTSWAWNFGDGGNSSAQNPSYQYTSAGTYTVTLTVSNCAGSDLVTKVDYVTVTEPPCTETTPVADFSGSPTSGDAALTVNFTDLSTNNPNVWSWDFGDGGNSSAQNPTYQYTSAGTYTVTLTASNCAGSDVATQVDYITVTAPPVDAMHVHDIVVTRVSRGPNWNGLATITIYDQDEQPVANATVFVTADGPTGGSGSGATNSNGQVSFKTSKTKNPVGEWCFEVTNVTHSTNTYNSASNHVTKACESGVVFSGDFDDRAIQLRSAGSNEIRLSNHPNPFNPTTEISFTLPTAAKVSLDVFNVLGQRVKTLVDGYLEAGEHSITWNSNDGRQGPLSSGVYFYRLRVDAEVFTRKMFLLK